MNAFIDVPNFKTKLVAWKAYYAWMCEDIIFVIEIPFIKPVHWSWHFWSIYAWEI